jgi:DnaJ-class molecular chaperone
VECHVCDGRGRYFGSHGLVDPCERCKGQKRIPCTRYGCEDGYLNK